MAETRRVHPPTDPKATAEYVVLNDDGDLCYKFFAYPAAAKLEAEEGDGQPVDPILRLLAS